MLFEVFRKGSSFVGYALFTLQVKYAQDRAEEFVENALVIYERLKLLKVATNRFNDLSPLA
jgi:hypothetical protein